MRKLCARSNLASSSPPSELPRSSSSSPPQKAEAKLAYEKNLRGMKKIAFVTNLTIVCNWFLGFCALTWASAVLLGAYVEQLSMWDYYDVSLLLFIEGLRFGLAAMVRFLGYRLWDLSRWALRSVAFFLPLGMGGFAVLSMLPPNTRHRIHLHFAGRKSSLLLSRHDMLPVITAISHPLDPAPPPSDSTYTSLSASLKIFYILVLLNAFVLLLGSSITGLMRLHYVRSTVKSLCKYHDKMMDGSSSWLLPAVDLSFGFQIQGSEYRKGRDARYVCQNYADLIYYLYMHDKGVEAAEVALATEDGYVREAAANIVGFWAVLETLEGVKGSKLPLCFQRGLLSKLADIAAESYGSLGIAVARSFSLLLALVDLELIGMVAYVNSKSTAQCLIDILLGRAAELLYPPCPYKIPSILRKESHAHIYALSQYLSRLQTDSGSTTTAAFIENQQAQLVKRIKEALPELVKQVSNGSTSGGCSNERIIQDLREQLSTLLVPTAHHQYEKFLLEPAVHDQYDQYLSDIRQWLKAPLPLPNSWRASTIKATFLLLFNIVALPLACLGVGFIVNALLWHLLH